MISAAPTDTLVVGASVFDDVITHFSRLRYCNTVLLEALAERWSVAASDIRAMYFLARYDDVTPKRVADHLGITTGAMTSLIDRLERAGLAERAANPSDRRSIVIELTGRGESAINDALTCYRDGFSSAIGAEDAEEVAALFERVADALAAQTLSVVRASD